MADITYYLNMFTKLLSSYSKTYNLILIVSKLFKILADNTGMILFQSYVILIQNHLVIFAQHC